MTGWQVTLCYGLTLLAILLVTADPPKGPVVNLPLQPPQYIYVSVPLMPDRNPTR